MGSHDRDVMVLADKKARRAVRILFSFLVFFFAGVLAGCGRSGGSDNYADFKDPNGNPIKAAIKTNIPLAYAASAAMAAAET